MAVYFIVDVDVKNANAYESYKHSAAASIAQYGGRYRRPGWAARGTGGGVAPDAPRGAGIP